MSQFAHAGISDKMCGVPGDQGDPHVGAIKARGAGATTFTRSCVFPGVALGLRVPDLTLGWKEEAIVPGKMGSTEERDRKSVV